MKKIYIITFHWATNYGAILQSYALQEYLKSKGYDVEIINYTPRNHKKTFLKCWIAKPKSWLSNLREFKKESKLKEFRKKYLNLTKNYSTYNQLKKQKWDDAIFICGSDQIWNSFFTLHGEGCKTLSYYLGFAPKTSIKISYAASFGAVCVDEKLNEILLEQLNEFSAVSVRENSGVEILSKIGIESTLVCDPVFLHDSKFYEKFIDPSKQDFCDKKIFSYILHQDDNASRILNDVALKTGCEVLKIEDVGYGLEDWIKNISSSSIVVTNSFHATAIAILFHVPFVSVLLEGSGMNDRINTLLKALGLSSRIIASHDTIRLSEILSTQIEWDVVDENIKELTKSGVDFLNNSLIF